QQNRQMNPNGQPFNPHQQNRPEEAGNAKPLTETKPADVKPADTKPADTKPADVKPAETNPFGTKPADTNPFGTKTVDTVFAEIDKSSGNGFTANAQHSAFETPANTFGSKPEVPAYMNVGNTQANQPKREIKYNEQALTPPDKKKTSIIIGVCVVAVLLLIVGVVGLASTMGEGFKDKFEKLSSGIEDLAADYDNDDYDNDNDDYDYDNDDYSDSEDMYGYSDVAEKVLNYSYTDIETDEFIQLAEVVMTTPDNFGVSVDMETPELAAYYNQVSDIICTTELVWAHIVNPEGRLNEFLSFEEFNSYKYLEQDESRRILQVEFSDHTEMVALFDVNDEITLVVRALYLNGDVSDYSPLIDVVNTFVDNAQVVY
ncbi:MAG: hypothetical protein UD936_06445, partial [Acutalibacteraceae bacterium]|nr:hypothetical protein [Acutalibacteraceae bacterium]